MTLRGFWSRSSLSFRVLSCRSRVCGCDSYLFLTSDGGTDVFCKSQHLCKKWKRKKNDLFMFILSNDWKVQVHACPSQKVRLRPLPRSRIGMRCIHRDTGDSISADVATYSRCKTSPTGRSDIFVLNRTFLSWYVKQDRSLASGFYLFF